MPAACGSLETLQNPQATLISSETKNLLAKLSLGYPPVSLNSKTSTLDSSKRENFDLPVKDPLNLLLDCYKEEENKLKQLPWSSSTSMAATAKHELRRKFPAEATSGDEDIAAIAKQISDHAEAIYQTWKSRGLAPTEILNCHNNISAADKFGTALTPSPNKLNSTNSFSLGRNSPVSSPADILAQDNNNLEKLVNNFVVEDKARIAASGQRISTTKSLPSSIQFALQKFERNTVQHSELQSPKTPTQTRPTSFISRPSQIIKSSGIKSPSGSHHSEVFLESIETSSYPHSEVITSSSKIHSQQKIRSTNILSSSPQLSSPTQSSILDGSPTSPGLGSWPLKNKILIDSRKPASLQLKTSSLNEAARLKIENAHKDFMDEVAREEERLINALKTGVALDDEDPIESYNSILPKQKPAILRETKPKVDVVKPILISPNQLGPLSSAGMVNSVVKSLSPVSSESKILSKDDLSSMSAVDYAKIRYQTAQQNSISQQRVEEQKSVTAQTFNSADQIVTSTRSKFESVINHNKDVVVVKDDKEKDKDLKLEKDFIASKWGLRLNPSTRPRIHDQVPHPELTTQQKQHIKAAAATSSGNNPVRPFLTRGSVAERVLIFEKCPSELLLDKRGPRPTTVAPSWKTTTTTAPEVQSKSQATNSTYSRDVAQPKKLPPHTTLQRHVKENKNLHIPRFHFPCGKPLPVSQLEATITRITSAFNSLPGHRASRSQFHIITKACDLPLYWKIPLFLASGGDSKEAVELNEFLDFWKDLCSSYHDMASKFIRIVTRDQCILPVDLIPLVQDVVETHPGLTFLKEATEFHSRYVHTVIARIFYYVNRSWSGKISVSELRRSNLLSVIKILEHEEDINKVTQYFSYEHFYVIYCKFWELDRDHDLLIDKMDLMRHNDHALSTRMVERIFSGAVTRLPKGTNRAERGEEKMSYTEFVWFLLSEGDKNHPTAIEYWFRCMDLDGDGYLSMYELEYFYEEQLHRMESIGIETLPFEDCLCQMLDMIRPKIPGKISLSDLKKCKMTSIFFDTFFNLEKFLDHEQRDPFASRNHDPDGEEMSDWDRFAAEEYELLVAEESANEQNDQSLYDSDAEDAYSPNLDSLVGESVDNPQQSSGENLGKNNYNYNDASSKRLKNNLHYDSCDSDDYADSDN